MPSRKKEDYKKHGNKYVYVSSNFQKQFSMNDNTVQIKTDVELSNNGEKVEVQIDIPLESKTINKKKKGITIVTDEAVIDDHDY